MTDSLDVAVVGAGGAMGMGIARNLLQAGVEVRAWNRSREKAEPLVKDGAQLFDSVGEALVDANVILTMLSDADAVLEIMEGEQDLFLGGLREEAVWVQMSTIGERGTERCMALAREHGLEFIDAPVLGTKQPAEDGELVIMASGPAALHDRVQPVFDAIGQRTMWLGEAGEGTRLKLATNSWILAVVEGGAETFALAEGLGLDPQLVLEVIKGGPLDMPYLQMKGKAMIERNFDPSFRLALAAKDAGLVEDSAEEHNLDLPMLSAVRRRLDEGARAHGDEDMSSTFLTSAPAGASS